MGKTSSLCSVVLDENRTSLPVSSVKKIERFCGSKGKFARSFCFVGAFGSNAVLKIRVRSEE